MEYEWWWELENAWTNASRWLTVVVIACGYPLVSGEMKVRLRRAESGFFCCWNWNTFRGRNQTLKHSRRRISIENAKILEIIRVPSIKFLTIVFWKRSSLLAMRSKSSLPPPKKVQPRDGPLLRMSEVAKNVQNVETNSSRGFSRSREVIGWAERLRIMFLC